MEKKKQKKKKWKVQQKIRRKDDNSGMKLSDNDYRKVREKK